MKLKELKIRRRKKKVSLKKLSLEELKKTARLALKSGQKCVYSEKMIKENWSYTKIYRCGRANGKMQNPPVPKKMARSVLCAARIFKFYGKIIFEEFLNELKSRH